MIVNTFSGSLLNITLSDLVSHVTVNSWAFVLWFRGCSLTDVAEFRECHAPLSKMC